MSILLVRKMSLMVHLVCVIFNSSIVVYWFIIYFFLSMLFRFYRFSSKHFFLQGRGDWKNILQKNVQYFDSTVCHFALSVDL